MVKNKKGGNKGKKGARKHLKDYGNKRKLRLSVDDDEVYAVVIKTFGHGMVDVMCNDGVIRLCHIRKKFSGRNKRDNLVNLNTLVLVGLRNWEVTDKKPKCDLLYVYSNNQFPELKKKVKFEDKLLNSITTNRNELIDEIEDDIGFDIGMPSDDEDELENMKIGGDNGGGGGEASGGGKKEYDYYGTSNTVTGKDKRETTTKEDMEDTWEDEWDNI